VPIDDVAREAGVGIGTIHRHFPTKEDLYQAVVISRVESLVDAEAAFFGFLSVYTASAAPAGTTSCPACTSSSRPVSAARTNRATGRPDLHDPTERDWRT
jgi:AcrR family transcriptional regulator